MTKSMSRKHITENLPVADEVEMLRIAHRNCLKSFAVSKRFARQVESIALKALFASAGELYLHIYGLLGQELKSQCKDKDVVPLPAEGATNCRINPVFSDLDRLEQAALLDAYVLDLLRLIINRINRESVKMPLSSKIASLQILHDRMKELHDAYC